MKVKELLLWSGLLALLLPLGWRAAEYAAVPDFTPGIERHLRHQVELHGVELAVKTGTGPMTIRAESLRPGHERVGFFKLGPSSFIALRQVEARVDSGDGEPRTIRSDEARLDAGGLLFPEGALLRTKEGVEEHRSRMRIDFENTFFRGD